MFGALLVILTMVFVDVSKIRGFQFRPLGKISLYLFGAVFVGLLILGSKHVEYPYIEYGQIFTVAYFSFFLIIMPIISYIENSAIMFSISGKIESLSKKSLI
jgi:ubiquinol-cytochrome c reductase cytochrome b subunit